MWSHGLIAHEGLDEVQVALQALEKGDATLGLNLYNAKLEKDKNDTEEYRKSGKKYQSPDDLSPEERAKKWRTPF